MVKQGSMPPCTSRSRHVPQIVVQVVNAEPARGGKGLGGVALVSVALSATAIVVKTLQKLFEGCGGGEKDGEEAGRPRGQTRTELEAARREIEELRKAATPRGATTPSSPVGPSMVALEMTTTLSTNVATAPALATPRQR